MPRYDERSARYDDRPARYDDRSARYDDRSANSTRLYVGHLSSRTRSRDLEHIFSRYGRVRDVDMKHDYAFVDFSHYRDADDARHSLDGREVDGRRMIVEFAKGVPRGPGGVREYVGKGPPPGSGRCFNCGLDGHWARDCKAGDWKNKCYRCGERGHIEKKCPNSPQKTSHGRSYSRSPVRSRSPRRRRTPTGIRSRSYSRSRSPPRRKRVVEQERTSRSPSQSYSPDPEKDSSPSRTRKRSLTPDDNIPQESPASKRGASFERKEDEFSQSPLERSGSPLSSDGGGDKPALKRYDESPYETNERSRSGSPVGDRSPGDDYGIGGD